MKKTLLLTAVIFALISCGNRNNRPDSVEEIFPETVASNDQHFDVANSLVLQDGMGDLITRKYEGTIPAADVQGIRYQLTVWNQELSGAGVYDLEMTYISAEDGDDVTYRSYGNWHAHQGAPGNPDAVVYHMIPMDPDNLRSNLELNFIVDGENLTLLDNNMNRIQSEHNYTLVLQK